MPTIDVSPEGLREAGGSLNRAREELVTEGNAHLLHGVGDDQHISTAGFSPGVWAQEMLTRHYNRAQEVFGTINNNFIAISSGVHIVADLFETTDQEGALEFAFLNPDAEVPAGLPPYIDPTMTSVQLRARAEAEAALNGGGLPDGWTRRERTTSPYSSVVEIVDGNGNVVASMHQGYYGGQTTTRTYDRDNNLIGTRVESYRDGHETVSVYRGEPTPENLTREQHQVRNPDGSTEYYTNVVNPDGERERTDEMTIDPEPAGALPGDQLRRELDEGEHRAGNELMYQQHVENGPGQPQWYEGPLNRIRD